MMDPVLQKAAKMLASADFPWAFCGGFALELFLEKNLRPHGDIDICTFEVHRSCIVDFMHKQNWLVYEFRGQGKMRPLPSGAISDPGRNLMCFLPGCPLVEFFPCEEDGLFYHQFHHSGLQELNYLEFLFNPSKTSDTYLFCAEPPISLNVSKAILRTPDGIPYLAPELALLYKASRPNEGHAGEDFRTVYPHLAPGQKAWFQQALRLTYPTGHPWEE